jgi:hypothetical protein
MMSLETLIYLFLRQKKDDIGCGNGEDKYEVDITLGLREALAAWGLK